MRHRRSHENQAEGIPGDVLVTAMASRLADLQDSKAQDEASSISSPKSNDDAGRRALIAGSVFSFLERQIERGDTGYVSLNKVFSQLEGVIPNLVIEELRFVVRFLDVSRMLRYQNITDDAIEERSIREWSRLLMYQAKLDRIKLTSAGRLWLRVLKHREHWLFEDKEVEKLHIAIAQGIFEQVPIISSEIITSIRLFNEHLTEILESPSFRSC